jgi:N-acetylneuraminic acid mutarotase
MVIWGGRNATGLLQDGGLYDPASDSWAGLPLAGAPVARHQMAMTVAENAVFLWGGQGDPGLLGDGAALVLNPDGSAPEWRRLSDAGAPSPRRRHTAVWTGTRLIIWGGLGWGDAPLGDGKAYDPATDTWEDLPGTGAPGPRASHNAVWTGTEMLILAGANANGPLAAGGAYDPVKRVWRTLTSAGNPTPRHSATAVWTGTEVLIYGGVGLDGVVGALERLDPAGDWHLFRKP